MIMFRDSQLVWDSGLMKMFEYNVPWMENDKLKFLSSLRSPKITGSYARCEPNEYSDLDFQVSVEDWERIKIYLQNKGAEFSIDFIDTLSGIGHIQTYDERGNVKCDFFTQFNKLTTKSTEVSINHVRFGTW